MARTIGCVRAIDELGRYTIPVEMRRILGIQEKTKDNPGTLMQAIIRDDEIVIKKYVPGKACSACGQVNDPKDLKQWGFIELCSNCEGEIAFASLDLGIPFPVKKK